MGARLRWAAALARLLLALWLVACGAGASDHATSGGGDAAVEGGGDDSSTGMVRDLFADWDVLEVDVALEASDWDALRHEGRSLPRVFTGCEDRSFSYRWFTGTVALGGEETSDVAVRKKGNIGSLSVHRPSLKIDFGRDEHHGRTFFGTRRLTLNNNRSDPSNAAQCITYALFERAGLPAPRCGLARVRVNGVDKGFFSNVEPIKKPFLARVFGDDDGNLYEVSGAEFTSARVAYFELKTNERQNDRSDLDRVVQALQAPDQELVEALEEVIDLDEFIRFWAMETVAGHWDGLTGDRNNAYLYHDPSDDLFHAIPWGTDNALEAQHGLRADAPSSVYAFNTLSSRLYAIPETRRAFFQRQRELLDEVWDEDWILERLHAIAELTDANPAAVEEIERFVRERRAVIEREASQNEGEGPALAPLPASSAAECRPAAPASGRLEMTWNDAPMAYLPLPNEARPELDIPLPDGPLEFVPGSARQLATLNAEGRVQLGLVGIDVASGAQLFVGIIMPSESYRAGEIRFHGVETFGAVVQVGADADRILGFIGEGSVTLDEVSQQLGGAVTGSWEGRLAPLGVRSPMAP